MTGTPKKWVTREIVGNQMPCATLCAHFIRISWWSEEKKYISSIKDSGENNGHFLLFRQKMRTFLPRHLYSLFFDPQGFAHRWGVEKKRIQMPWGAKEINRIPETELFSNWSQAEGINQRSGASWRAIRELPLRVDCWFWNYCENFFLRKFPAWYEGGVCTNFDHFNF